MIRQKLETVAEAALDVIDGFLKQEEPDETQIARAKIACTTVSAFTRFEQTTGAREATTVVMARELSKNEADLKRYLTAALPNHAVIKALRA